MDFDRLRKESIDFNQQASGDRWTDYNFHDPGVTILEQFCYALTDIAYRTNLDVETILFHAGDVQRIRASHALHTPDEILTPGPITSEDYRILLLDGFPNTIRNCWVTRIEDHGEGVRGLYDVTLLLHGHLDEAHHAGIRDEVRRFLTRYRNLSEDFDRIVILDPLAVAVSADIDLFQDAPGEEILSEILFRIEEYFNPMVRFRTFDEMEKTGLRTEEIFDTPSHQHGFIDRRELAPRPEQYYVSRLGDCISAVRGVKMLRNISVTIGGVPVYGDSLDVPMRHYLTLGFTGAHFADSFFSKSKLNLHKGGALISFSAQTVVNLLEIRLARTHRNYPVRSEWNEGPGDRIKTEELLSYDSVQRTFPGVYGVGDFTPAQEEGALRLAQSAQLKAYLLLFDQVMSNHLAQLAGIAELFSVEVTEDLVKTYFAQQVPDEQTGAGDLLHHIIGPVSELRSRIGKLEAEAAGSAATRFELAACRADLAEKENQVNERIQRFLRDLSDMTLTHLKRSEYSSHREIVRLATALIGTVAAGTRVRFVGRGSKNLTEEQASLVAELSGIMREHLLEQPLDCAFRPHHLERLMQGFDRGVDRKNRILSHYLARFGERFSADFHGRVTAAMEEDGDEAVGRRLLMLKSAFLKEIRTLGRFRAQGQDYLSAGSAAEVPLRRRLCLQFDITHPPVQRLTTTARKSPLKAASLDRRDILSEKREDGQAYIRLAGATSGVRFVVNTTDYQSYLFRFAVERRNYSIVPESGQVAVYFSPSNRDTPSRIMVCANRKEAESRIGALIRALRELNARQEGFHLVDHILLRPMDMQLCRFMIHGEGEELWLVSKEARTREVQQRDAFDTVLLACYSNNYKILRTSKKEFVVVVKNAIGKEMATAARPFLTELSAQEFIDRCVLFFNIHREADTLHSLFELDDETKFFFCILDRNKTVLMQATEPSDLSGQEKQALRSVESGLYPDRYRIEGSLEKGFTVVLTDDADAAVARSRSEFQTEEQAKEFIRTTVRLLDEVRDGKSLLQYRRVNGRNSDDFNAQLSVVFPVWTSRFGNADFRQMFIRAVHESVPAHLAVNVIGLTYAEMHSFEDLYFSYLKELSGLSLENRHTVAKLSGDLLDLLTRKNQSAKVG